MNLELEAQPPGGSGADNTAGTKSNAAGGGGGGGGSNSGGISDSSTLGESGPTSQAPSLSLTLSAYQPIAADIGARRSSTSPRLTPTGGSQFGEGFRDKPLPKMKTWGGGDELPGRDRDSEGTRSSHGRERSATAGSSSSDDSMTGKNALSGDAVKQQWEEAMGGGKAPETPLRSRRGSNHIIAGLSGVETSATSARGRMASRLFFPAGGKLHTATYGTEALSTSRGRERAGSVGAAPAVTTAASVLGTHLRTYGWVADDEVGECMNACGSEFTPWERRHHCRCCGGIFCHDCSRHRCLVPDPVGPPYTTHLDPRRPHRVCNACYVDVQPSQGELLATVSNARRHNAFNTDSPQRHCNPPFGLDLAHEVRKSANTLNNLLSRRQGCDGLSDMTGAEQDLSHHLVHNARGLVFVTVAKAGLMYAAEGGTGLCVARLVNGDWSAPAAVGTLGVSWGFQVGCEVVDMLIPLRSDAAVEMLKSGGQVYVEVDAAVAVGPLGRSVGTGVNGRTWPGEQGSVDVGARYSLSKGLFAGVGIGAGFLRVMDRVNERFYGAQVTPRSLLSGVMPRPPAANPLYSSLDRLNRASAK